MRMMRPTSVLIADDQTLFREGLRLLLANEPAIAVVGEAADSLQAVRLVEALQPDILLLTVNMAGPSTLEAIALIRQKSAVTQVLVLSRLPEDALIGQALQVGAKGYLSTALGYKDLLKAIQAVHAGEIWAERKVLAEVLEHLRQKTVATTAPLSERHEALTEREQEIVRWAIQGMTNKEIAVRLGISDKTVKSHLGHIFGKLQISRRLQLALTQLVDQPN